MTRQKKTALFILIGVIVALPIYGRLHAWWSAVQFGQVNASAFATLGVGGLADTAGLKKFLEEPPLSVFRNRAARLPIVGSGYARRMDEFQAAMIHLSEQTALPVSERSSAPLKLEYFTVQPVDTTTQGLADAAGRLILEYRAQVATPW